MVLEKTLECLLDCKEIQPKGKSFLKEKSILRKSVLNIHWKD